jgi:hypothetical protein
MEIMEIINWLTAFVTVASVVSAMTPTKKDDAIVSKITKIIDMLALNVANSKRR